MTRKIRIYMAGPLFTRAEREWNEKLAAAIEAAAPILKCVLPQVRAEAYLPDLAAVVEDCFAQVEACDAVLACLDGPDADSGTCVEVGFAIARGKPTVCYRTDLRSGEVDGVNAMLRYGCQTCLDLGTGLHADEVGRVCAAAIRAALGPGPD